ncbi:hypothetical protein HPB50_015835 [Hyalomma asiaticum]|uniref:Uncharacterized protein n=1 Tax=Hyalomma asiaticum TaxID=266040 RepID=A0ACB7RNV2_HYAAI|nr:hypothetical protein HPB50_015835 [Hyalomma asiaticum]
MVVDRAKRAHEVPGKGTGYRPSRRRLNLVNRRFYARWRFWAGPSSLRRGGKLKGYPAPPHVQRRFINDDADHQRQIHFISGEREEYVFFVATISLKTRSTSLRLH